MILFIITLANIFERSVIMDANKVKIYRRSLIAVIVLAIASCFLFVNNVSVKAVDEPETVNVDISDEIKVLPCGFPVGIYLETDGVMVISCGAVEGIDGIMYEPALDKFKPGDYIVSVNEIDVSSKSQLLFLINKYGNETLHIKIRRGKDVFVVDIDAVETVGNEYKIGVWVRDDTQGIGTMTYVTSDGKFGALGHGISDIDTGELLSSDTGLLYNARIWGIKKGVNGTPGGLCGTINYEDENIIGKIDNNTEIGIFGNIDEKVVEEKYGLSYVNICGKDEIKKGTAYIRSMVSGEIKDYEILITDIEKNEKRGDRQITLVVTDEELLDITNGIVQGMSGSPIIQDEKLVGAVTHVLVNDPTKGYGIFIEDMLEHD